MNAVSWNMPWLLLLALQPLIVVLLRSYFEQRNINCYVKKEFQPWVIINNNQPKINKILNKNTAYCFAWILFAIAAAGPRVADKVNEDVSDTGRDIMIVLDISQSMHATDLTPSRLSHAHKKIEYLINNINNSRIGIIIYAAKPHLYVPLTYDKEALNFYLKNIKFLIPPSQGSHPSLALELAKNHLEHKDFRESKHPKSIVLMTDADSAEKESNKLNKFPRGSENKHIPVFTLVMASNHGEAIPDFNDGWVNIKGNTIVSRPVTKNYQLLSDKSGGILKNATDDDSDIISISSQIHNHTTDSITPNKKDNWNELFTYFLFPAIILMFIVMFPYKLQFKKLLHSTHSMQIFVLTCCIAIFAFTSIPAFANQQDDLRDAYEALINKNYIKSRELYSSINGFEGRFGEGVSSYRLADYPRAIRLFKQAVLLAETDSHLTQSLYNLGNSYFEIGNYKQAISSFDGALKYQPQHMPSSNNLVYSKKALAAVEKKSKQLAITNRAGRGPRSALAADNLIFNDTNNVSLSDNESKTSPTKNSSLSNDNEIPAFIILRGIEFASGSPSKRQKVSTDLIKNIENSTHIAQYSSVYDNQPALWQRIFEIEEGYPAPLEKPDVLPGILPW